MKKTIKIFASIFFILLSVLGYVMYTHHRTLYPETDDAYIQAHVVNIASRVSGRVIKTHINNNDSVKKGQLLFELDPKPFQLAVDKAESQLKNTQQTMRAQMAAVNTAKANVEERLAQEHIAAKNDKRMRQLVEKGSVSKQQSDTSDSDLKQAKATLKAAKAALVQAEATLGSMGKRNAAVQAAKAELDTAKLNLSYTKIYASANGTIAHYSLRIGDQINAQQDYFALVESAYWWATANFKETQIDRIKANQPAKIQIDMYPNQTFIGKVVSISQGSGTSFALLPPENATGNWVKVTQRFPVRIVITSRHKNHPLRMGASCTVTVDTSK